MHQELPVISVIIPVYNSPEGIRATLSCIKAQNYPPYKLEIIVVDNGSSDNTIEVIKEFEGVNLHEEKEMQGSYAARNKGIKAAKGSIFAFTDADCEPVPDWLQNGVSTMFDKQVELAAGEIQVICSDTPNLWEYYDALKHLDQEIM